MPSLRNVSVVASGPDRRTGRCTVFDTGRGKLAMGAISHDKGEGARGLPGGTYIIDVAYDTLLTGRGKTYTTADYEDIPIGVTLVTQFAV